MRRFGFVLWLMSGPALAGDPCPITFDVYEATPEWRNREADLAALQRKDGIVGFVYRDLRITSVVPGDPADVAGIRVGDTIGAVNGISVRDHAHADELLRAKSNTASLTIGRNNETITHTIAKKPADPLLMHMLQMVTAVSSGTDAKAPCLQMRLGKLSPEQHQYMHQAAFYASRGFRCTDAHTRIPTSAFSGQQPLIMVRGGTRILLTVPDWGTTCADVAEYDGDKLTHQRVLSLVQEVGKRYIQDRHDNP